ncbi:MAG: L,D-transpeptidase [Negativicutes bacterium]|nr:L,D-transpeptidase [Negativicutes bacterium]
MVSRATFAAKGKDEGVTGVAYSIVIDLSARQLVLYREGFPARFFPVGVGKMATPTPAGTYYVAAKRPNPGGPFGAMWLGLSIPHYGIHGTNNPSSIGHYVSHGCIRMHNADVLELSGLIPVGTPVTIKG